MAAARGTPAVSVVIASYCWPQALRLSLESALAQSVGDIEVLVVEDGDDEASDVVVRELGDPRVRRLSLFPGAGSQSGPNTLGLREAVAPVVAYLGHDDLWHPDHLAQLLQALATGADIAHAVSLLLPVDEGVRLHIAGTRRWDRTTFVPPSSIAHRRENPRIAPWRPAGDSGTPVDHAWLTACADLGATFATTGRPTVFKFVAAWRLDSYVTRDVQPQEQLRARLATEPELGPELLAAGLADGVAPVVAAPPELVPGVVADHNRRMKGLPARFGPRQTRWTPDPMLIFRGWHAAERDADGAFAWTGAAPRAMVRLDAPGTGELGVRIIVRHVVDIEQMQGLVVDLDGEAIALHHGPPGDHWAITVTGWLGRPARGDLVEVGLTAPLIGVRDRDSDSPDDRTLGIAVGEIALSVRDQASRSRNATIR